VTSHRFGIRRPVAAVSVGLQSSSRNAVSQDCGDRSPNSKAVTGYRTPNEVSVADADRSITELRHLGIKFIDADWTLANEAGGFKSKYKCRLLTASPRRSQNTRVLCY